MKRIISCLISIPIVSGSLTELVPTCFDEIFGTNLSEIITDESVSEAIVIILAGLMSVSAIREPIVTFIIKSMKLLSRFSFQLTHQNK